MLTINLNLLRKSTKAEIAATIKYIKIANHIILLLIILSAATIILFLSQKSLIEKTKELNEITTPPEQKTIIAQINKNIGQLAQVQKDYIKWSRVLKNFFELTPPGIKLQSVRFDKENNIIYISGNAEKRDNFLKYKENLERADMIDKINSPISNLLHRTSFNFNLTAELKL
jgi:Tfp pilus assembly protein PilN